MAKAADLQAMFKEVYKEKDSFADLVPDNVKLLNKIDFMESPRQGDYLVVPLVTSYENGFTYLTKNAVTQLNDPSAHSVQEAQIPSTPLMGRQWIPIATAGRMVSTKASFAKWSAYYMKRLLKSTARRRELELLYGGVGLGQANGSTNSSSTKTVVDITTASWAAGIWSGGNGSVLNFYNSGSLVSSGSDADFTIESVDSSNKKLTVTGTSTGISALDTSLSSNTLDIYFKGAKGSEAKGLDYQITTTSGTVFNVDKDSNDLFNGSTYSAGSAALSLRKIEDAISLPVDKGGLSSDVICVVSPKTWSNLISDEAALRTYDGNNPREKAERGSKSICFYSQNGEIEVLPHPMCKQGEAQIFSPEHFYRTGVAQMSTKHPERGDEMFFDVQDYDAVEMRIYDDQAPFLEQPACAVKINNIVND